tara:strand:+ start:18828 stop:19064 length:237 start_codon:yes stop_codon:yes gene_type:complete
MLYTAGMKPSAVLAPELLRAAMRAGVDVGWDVTGGAYAQITDKRSSRQRAAFEALMCSAYAPDILHGLYYAGDYSRLQ